MNGIKMVEAKLPPGFRFHPRDEELICDYLMKKLTRSELPPFLQEVDLNKSEPWDIPEAACVGGKEWYFYSLRDRKYATGKRTNRATLSGYWKATGKDRPVSRRGRLVGMRKTLVFYQGRAPKGKKTEWVMHEFRVEPPSHTYMSSKKQEDWVLCRVFHKNKEVPDNGGSNQGTRRSWYDENKVINPNYSPNLPPLMDHSYISFNHNQLPYQQVPCFSNTFSTTNKTPNHIINNNNSNSPIIITKNVDLHPQNHQPIPCENKRVLDSVLNQYICDGNYTSNITVPPPSDDMVSMMIKDSSTSFAEGSSESLVSELRFPGWNDQYFDMYSSSECVPTFTV